MKLEIAYNGGKFIPAQDGNHYNSSYIRMLCIKKINDDLFHVCGLLDGGSHYIIFRAYTTFSTAKQWLDDLIKKLEEL